MLNKKALAGTPSTPPVYVEDVFSTYLYSGTGATQTINNGIDLAGKGGAVWVKSRSNAYDNWISADSNSTNLLITNNTDSAYSNTGGFANWEHTSTGFNILAGAGSTINGSGSTFCSWTFREQAKFFDVVTYTGNGTARTIAHNLGSVPGMIIVKRTDTTGDWQVYHRSLANTEYLVLNTTAAKATGATRWNSTTPTSTEFSLGTDATVNANTGTYVAYLFAHDAGGFGAAGTDNVISCGSFTGDSTVTLGYEPQWIMFKRTDSTGNWRIIDNMRGMPVIASSTGSQQVLFPNTSGAESTDGVASPTATGFQTFLGGGTYIYMAIRRPMKTPTSGTEVFSVTTGNFTTPKTVTTNFPVDLSYSSRTGGSDRHFIDRLRGGTTTSYRYLATNQSSAEIVGTSAGIGMQSNTSIIDNDFVTGADAVWWSFRRAPGFFDTVCYTGTAATQNITHNLGVAPELIIIKSRSGARSWAVYAQPLGNTKYLLLNTGNVTGTSSGYWNDTTPTSSVFTIGSDNDVSLSGATFVSYLFATLAGISKVGSYTGTGTTQTINCGFTSGARFVLIRRTDAASDWYIYDTARGIVSGNDPFLLANTSAAQTTNTDYIDPASSGFEISSTAPDAINANGGSFIFLAIA